MKKCAITYLHKNNPRQVMFDPPSGWRYGFPKPYKPLPGETLNQTLLRDGYPQSEIDSWEGDEVPCQFWEAPEPKSLKDSLLPDKW